MRAGNRGLATTRSHLAGTVETSFTPLEESKQETESRKAASSSGMHMVSGMEGWSLGWLVQEAWSRVPRVSFSVLKRRPMIW
jgi:hypothetical protein